MNPPTRVSRKIEPMRLVSVFEALDELKYMTYMKYSTRDTMLAINPMFSSADSTVPSKTGNVKHLTARTSSVLVLQGRLISHQR